MQEVIQNQIQEYVETIAEQRMKLLNLEHNFAKKSEEYKLEVRTLTDKLENFQKQFSNISQSIVVHKIGDLETIACQQLSALGRFSMVYEARNREINAAIKEGFKLAKEIQAIFTDPTSSPLFERLVKRVTEE